MKNLKLFIVIILPLFFACVCHAQSDFKKISKDFKKLSGSWQGSLTYLDYSSGKPYTMAADIEIHQLGKTKQFIFSNIYPKEPNANSMDTIFVASTGKFINKEMVKSRRKLPNGDIEIITEESGKDGNDNKPALFRHTYTLGATTYTNRKDVQFVGKTEWMNRHVYSYTKK